MSFKIHAGIFLAAMAACGVAQAQSSVTLYGKVDLGLQRAIGSSDTHMATGGDSRIGVRGVEDLGGGLKAFFGFEQRIHATTGAIDGDGYKGYTHVGLQGGFGKVGLGRQYVAAFSLVQNQIDPFEGDTVAQVRDVGMRFGGITKVRVNSSIRYDHKFGPVNVAASIADKDTNGNGPDRPMSLAANWKNGPLFLAAGWENPSGDKDYAWNLGAAYDISAATVSLGFGRGKTDAGASARGLVLGLNVPVGAGVIKAAYGTNKVGGVTGAQKVGLGYHYFMSKRTMLYVDVAHDNKAAKNKSGMDFGIRHTF